VIAAIADANTCAGFPNSLPFALTMIPFSPAPNYLAVSNALIDRNEPGVNGMVSSATTTVHNRLARRQVFLKRNCVGGEVTAQCKHLVPATRRGPSTSFRTPSPSNPPIVTSPAQTHSEMRQPAVSAAGSE